MDQIHSRITAVACLLFRAGQRLRLGIRVWQRELGGEPDDALKSLVESLVSAYAETKPLLEAALRLQADSNWDPLLARVARLAADLGVHIIDPWNAAKTTGRRVLAQKWRRRNPVTRAAGELEHWFTDLETEWLRAARLHCHQSPAPPIPEVEVSIFIASSSEGLAVAKGLQTALKKAKPSWKLQLWKDPHLFKPGESTLEGLERVIGMCDFGVYILTPDDKLTIRNKNRISARGNVLFELGMGVGMHRRKRSLVMHDQVYRISDLDGITTLPYKPRLGTEVPGGSECRRLSHAVIDAVAAEALLARQTWRGE